VLRLEQRMAYKCGEKPGKGRYICTTCWEDLYLDDDTDTLPPCAKCATDVYSTRHSI